MNVLAALGFALLVFGVTVGALLSLIGFHWWEPPVGAAVGVVAGGIGWFTGEAVGGAWKLVTVDGASTPYERQFSYEQALVMQGRADDALASFEAVMAVEPEAVAPRVKAAELYVKEKKNHARAAELFREALRLPSLTSGEDIYVTNRLVDLYLGPLNEPGRAMVELRRLVERRPGTSGAEHARRSLADLKSRMQVGSESGSYPARRTNS